MFNSVSVGSSTGVNEGYLIINAIGLQTTAEMATPPQVSWQSADDLMTFYQWALASSCLRLSFLKANH